MLREDWSEHIVHEPSLVYGFSLEHLDLIREKIIASHNYSWAELYVFKKTGIKNLSCYNNDQYCRIVQNQIFESGVQLCPGYYLEAPSENETFLIAIDSMIIGEGVTTARFPLRVDPLWVTAIEEFCETIEIDYQIPSWLFVDCAVRFVK